MEKQNYKNHIRYYFPHHFILLPLLFIMVCIGIGNYFFADQHKMKWLLFGLLSFCILYLAIMLRQHYALGNQDRIIRLEFRLRYFELYNRSSKEIEKALSFKQIAALRFADDDEFKLLLDRALKENLTGDQIKRAITNWQADNMRL